MIYCPKSCGAKSEFKVWGSSYFSWKSSICRASLFAKTYKDDEGGLLWISISEVFDGTFGGGSSGGIESLESPALPTDKSFTVRKYNVKCPIKKFEGREDEEEVPPPGNPPEPPSEASNPTPKEAPEKDVIKTDDLN